MVGTHALPEEGDAQQYVSQRRAGTHVLELPLTPPDTAGGERFAGWSPRSGE